MAAFQADDGYEEPHVIAEIGCNHMGQFEIAKELLTLAKNAGATVGKFQKRCPKELLTEEQYNAQHPNPHNSYGETYGAHREFLELDVEQHRLLQKHCEEIGLLYSCSVWDTTSAKEIASLNPPLIKVGSPSNQHWEMQKVLRDEYSGMVHISTGMTTKDEVEKIVSFWEQGKGNAKERVILYNCSIGRRRAPARGNPAAARAAAEGCPLRGGGAAASEAPRARGSDRGRRAEPRSVRGCCPASGFRRTVTEPLCLLHTGRSASAPHALARAAPLVSPMSLAMDRSGAAGPLLQEEESSRETLAQGEYGEPRWRSSWRGPGCSSPT